MIHPLSFRVGLALLALLTGCSVAPVDSGGGATPAPSTTLTAPATVLEGHFDVGGHKLYLKCEGSAAAGSPSVIYLHGLSHIADGGEANMSSAGGVPTLVSVRHRYCGYDRANVGRSDEAPGPLSGRSSARDLAKLLQAAEVEPPYLLLGASFGGLVAEIYAAQHPKDVVGLVLLDAGFPDELNMEKLFPKDERLEHGKTGDSGWAGTQEQMDELAAYEDAYALIGKEPAIPVTYLLADPPSYSGPPAYEKAFPGELARFASRYSPGTVTKVDSEHYMEAAIPGRIATEIDDLVARLKRADVGATPVRAQPPAR